MSLPPPSPQSGPIYKLGLFINGINSGASEWYYFASSMDSFDDMFTGLKPFIRARQACLNYNLTNIAGVRIQLVGEANRSKLFFSSQLSLPTANTNAPELAPLAWLVAAYERSGNYKRKFWFRMLDQVDDTFGAPPFPGLTTPTAGFRQVFAQWADLLTTGVLQGNTGRGPFTFCIRAFSRNPFAGEQEDVTAVDIDPTTNSYRLTLDGANNIAIGTRILVRGFRGSILKGLSGPSYIIKEDLLGGDARVTISATPRAPGVPVVTRFGQIVSSEYQYFPITSLALERLATKRTGRPFFVTRGRRSVSR